MPQVDAQEDWTLLEATENGTWTYLKFSRLLYTCDEDGDYPITVISKISTFINLKLYQLLDFVL